MREHTARCEGGRRTGNRPPGWEFAGDRGLEMSAGAMSQAVHGSCVSSGGPDSAVAIPRSCQGVHSQRAAALTRCDEGWPGLTCGPAKHRGWAAPPMTGGHCSRPGGEGAGNDQGRHSADVRAESGSSLPVRA